MPYPVYTQLLLKYHYKGFEQNDDRTASDNIENCWLPATYLVSGRYFFFFFDFNFGGVHVISLRTRARAVFRRQQKQRPVAVTRKRTYQLFLLLICICIILYRGRETKRKGRGIEPSADSCAAAERVLAGRPSGSE